MGGRAGGGGEHSVRHLNTTAWGGSTGTRKSENGGPAEPLRSRMPTEIDAGVGGCGGGRGGRQETASWVEVSSLRDTKLIQTPRHCLRISRGEGDGGQAATLVVGRLGGRRAPRQPDAVAGS